MFSGSCAQQKVLSNAYSLQTIKDKYDTGSELPYGRNFNFVENASAWMTGMRVFGSNMIISNRGNNNTLDSNDVRMFKIAISNTTGSPDETLNLGTSTFTSIDGFDLANDGIHLIVAAFHGTGGVRSGTIPAFDFDNTTFTPTGSLKSSGGQGVRACSWGNDGNKYYMGYGSTIRQFTTSSPYEVASGDTEGTSKNIGFSNVSDITFNPDGTKMYVSEHDGNLHEFTLTSAWDSSTTSSQITVDVSDFFGNEGVSPSRTSTNTGTTMWICGMHWNDDGTKLYINSLWGMTDTNEMANNDDGGSPSSSKGLRPTTVVGVGGSRTNSFAVIEYSVG